MVQSTFDSIKIQLASPDQIREWAYRVLPSGERVGEVTQPETFNFRTQQPEVNGLFCEKIFGPIKNWQCRCGRYKFNRPKQNRDVNLMNQSLSLICESCGVEVTHSKIRRYRIGCIELSAPIAHIWYFKNNPSYISNLLGFKLEDIENMIYFIDTVSDSYFEFEDNIANLKLNHNVNQINYSSFSSSLNVTNIFYDLESCYKEPQNSQIGAELIYNFLKLVNVKTLFSVLCEQLIELRPAYYYFNNKYKKVRNQIRIINVYLRKKKWKLKKNIKVKLENRKKDLTEQKKDLKNILRRLRDWKTRNLRRLRIIKNFLKAKAKPEWMILFVLPVLPPDLRPVVQLNAGHLATSDLNDLYKKVINRNNRLKSFQQCLAPEIILRNEIRLLQESVDSLIYNNRPEKLVVGSLNRPLKSLSELLEGKQGRFRQNLLGKRVDYSGRSVIVVDPHLKIWQCGLPKEMAIELFQPFIVQHLIQNGLAKTIKGAKKKVQNRQPIVYKILKLILKNHPILLNRAPTLHRLSIQAFEPILINSRAIKLHPLVCPPFNADFDGDQMAVHVPLSYEAQAEARLLLLSTNNLISPASGQPISSPSQDMILGFYYLTTLNRTIKPYIKQYFSDFKHVLSEFNSKNLSVQTIIWVRILDTFYSISSVEYPLEIHLTQTGKYKLIYVDHFIEKPTNLILIRTTIGRILFNQLIQDCIYN